MGIIYRLNSLINYEKKGGYVKTLENFYDLLEKMGNPHKALKNVIHVVGTKGKGSVSYIVSKSLENSGFRVGLFTSPHLTTPLERIRINGRCISEDELERIAGKILDLTNERGFKTFFEVMTASAIQYFLEKNVDYSVFEAGLGGRLDATNVLNQRVVVITRIDYDHTDILGNTLESITREKSAVIKSGIPVITTKKNERVLKIIKERAGKFKADVIVVDWKEIDVSDKGVVVEVEGKEIRAPLLGRFQCENLALSFKVLEILGIKEPNFKGVYVPGRFQILSRNPALIVDGAHNPLSISSFIKSLREMFPEKRFKLVLSISSDKDIEGISKEIPDEYEVFITRYPFPRAESIENLFRILSKRGIYPRVLTSVPEIVSLAGRGDVVITGSFYLVGELLSALKYAL